MEILREGKLKTYIFECSECGCVFLADSSEVDYYHTVVLITSPYMHCPHCHVKEVSGDAVTEKELEEIKKNLERATLTEEIEKQIVENVFCEGESYEP